MAAMLGRRGGFQKGLEAMKKPAGEGGPVFAMVRRSDADAVPVAALVGPNGIVRARVAIAAGIDRRGDGRGNPFAAGRLVEQRAVRDSGIVSPAGGLNGGGNGKHGNSGKGREYGLHGNSLSWLMLVRLPGKKAKMAFGSGDRQ
jgi:hypothetical protein